MEGIEYLFHIFSGSDVHQVLHIRYSPYSVFHESYITVLRGNPSSVRPLSVEVFMTNQTPQSLLRNWRELYSAALFETDKNRIPTRIADAEKAIVARARELFSAGADTIEEDQALDDALYALRALQNCLEFRAAA